MIPDLSMTDNKMKQANIRFGKEHVALPMLAAPNLTPGRTGHDTGKEWGPEASNPGPYNEGDKTNPEELNAQREVQRADREKRRFESLNERIGKLEERMTKVKADNPNDEQLDRLQKSIERLQKRREDLKREMENRPAVEIY
jgi:TolA-binding protein